MENPFVIIDDAEIPIEGESNLIEVIRKAGTELPTFCYYSDISVYGACRMCMVDIEGWGLMPACSTKPEEGMVVRTNTRQIQVIRKMVVELMLASHDSNCLTCAKNTDCKLQAVAKQLGVQEVRFRRLNESVPFDLSSDAIFRDMNRCILCGDCVRICDEIQSVGALDFAYRGAQAKVVACFNKGLGETECVNCGQCAKVCPVGALTPKYEIQAVWDAIFDPEKTVVVQVAPAVRVSLGEYFGEKPGTLTIGKIISALRRIGFDQVFDTCFAADFTVVEEGREFLDRYEKGENLPLFTSNLSKSILRLKKAGRCSSK